MKHIMASNRSDLMIYLLILVISTTITIAFGNHEQAYRQCMDSMKKYCNHSIPEIIDCARGAILLYRKNGRFPEYIKLYFNDIVYPNTLVSVIEPPLVFCQQTGFVDFYKDAVSGFLHYIPPGQRLLDMCLAHLKDFRDHLNEFGENSNLLKLAFFDKDINSYYGEKYFAAFYLNYISWNVYIKDNNRQQQFEVKKCKDDMKIYCKSSGKEPNPVDCAKEAILSYHRMDKSVPAHIHEYFSTVISANFSVKDFVTPEQFCLQKVYRDKRHLKDLFTLEGSEEECLANLVDFIGDSDDVNPRARILENKNISWYIIEVAFFQKNLDSFLGNPFASLYLHCVSRSINGFSERSRYWPNKWCEFYMRAK